MTISVLPSLLPWPPLSPPSSRVSDMSRGPAGSPLGASEMPGHEGASQPPFLGAAQGSSPLNDGEGAAGDAPG